jgi:hypothetical protein
MDKPGNLPPYLGKIFRSLLLPLEEQVPKQLYFARTILSVFRTFSIPRDAERAAHEKLGFCDLSVLVSGSQTRVPSSSIRLRSNLSFAQTNVQLGALVG